MKLLLTLSTFVLSLGCANAPKNLSFAPKQAQKSVEITSFNDFIATEDELKSYYGDIKNLAGEDLILALENVISQNNNKPSYSGAVSGRSADWTSYFLLDRDYEKSPLDEYEIKRLNKGSKAWWNYDNLYCEVLYEPVSIKVERGRLNKTGENTIHIDREHVFPKSYGFNGPNSKDFEKYMAGCDMHNLHMGESRSNQNGHNDFPYGNVAKNKTEFRSYTTNEVGSYNGYHETFTNQKVFEPLDKDKGDIARSTLYMGTRYHTYKDTSEVGEGASPRILLSDNPYKIDKTVYPSQTKDNDTSYGILTDLLEWTALDEVTDHERIRNTLCQKYIQGNRNPFIDFPLWSDVAFNPNTKYVADIDSPNGVSLNTKPYIEGVKDQYKEGETLNFDSINLLYKENGNTIKVPKDEIKFILKDLKTNKQSVINDGYVLSGGNFELILKHVKNGNTLREASIKFVVTSIKDTLSVATNIDTKIKTTTPLNLKNVKFQYVEDGTTIVVPYDQLKFELTNKLNNKTIEIEDGYTIKEAGNYNLKISYTTEDNIELSTTVELEVKQAQFWEDKKFQKLLIIIASIILAIILIILIIILIKKLKKKS